MFGYRTTLACDRVTPSRGDVNFEVYNIGISDIHYPYCSERSGPGYITMLMYKYNNQEFENFIEKFSYIYQDIDYDWQNSIDMIKKISKFRMEKMSKLKSHKRSIVKEEILRRFQDSYQTKKWSNFEKWVKECQDKCKSVLRVIQRGRVELKIDPNKMIKQTQQQMNQNGNNQVQQQQQQQYKIEAIEGEKHPIICFDARKAMYDIRYNLFTMINFCICLKQRYTCNLKTFAIFLHDIPLKVQNYKVPKCVECWKNTDLVGVDIEETGMIPPKYFSFSSADFRIDYFNQGYYQVDDKYKKEQERRLRLLCWGQIFKNNGDYYFELPRPVSSRFITLLCIDCHNNLPKAWRQNGMQCNIDVGSFIPFGFSIPSSKSVLIGE